MPLTSWVSALLQEVEHRFAAIRRCQRQVDIDIYACNNNRDCYTDAPAMRKLAELTMPISDPSKVDPPRSYSMLVKFSFGANEMEVTAYDEQTKEEVETSVVFIAKQQFTILPYAGFVLYNKATKNVCCQASRPCP